jgi:hypothetical protein
MEPLFRTGHDASTGETWQEEISAQELENIPESVFVYEPAIADEPVDDLVEGEQP